MCNYRLWRNKVSCFIEQAKKKYFQNAVSNCRDSKTIWKYIRNLNPKHHQNLVKNLECDGSILDNNFDIANAFNEHFTDIAEGIIDNSSEEPDFDTLNRFITSKLEHINEKFIISELDIIDVKLYLSKLDKSKATGLDDVGPKILSLCSDVIAPALTYILNLSIRSGKFPDIFKIARVCPVFKSGESGNPDNYRPIAVLPCLSKMIESHIAKQLYTYLKDQKLLHDSQSGFRPKHSCTTALTELIDEWSINIDAGEMNGVVFLDLLKAFDLVNHEILLKKLNIYNLSENTLKWLKSYLYERTQKVKICNILSESKVIKTGVPQGSILGPLLFILYINDLPLCIENSEIDMYADDFTLHSCSNDISELSSNLMGDILNIEDWCNRNSMKINPKKCKSMIIGSRQRLCFNRCNLGINIYGEEIQNVVQEKLLGLCIDNNLSWTEQVNRMSAAISSRINLLLKIRRFLPMHIRIIYFNAYILPLFDYCCTIWGDCATNGLEKLEKLLKKSARVILEADIFTSSKLLFNSLNWLNIENRIRYQKAILVFKSLNGMVPDYMQDKFRYNEQGNYNLRSAFDYTLQLPKPNTNFLKHTFLYSGAQLWNTLPLEIKLSTSLRVFKEKCFSLFQQNQYGYDTHSIIAYQL